MIFKETDSSQKSVLLLLFFLILTNTAFMVQCSSEVSEKEFPFSQIFFQLLLRVISHANLFSWYQDKGKLQQSPLWHVSRNSYKQMQVITAMLLKRCSATISQKRDSLLTDQEFEQGSFLHFEDSDLASFCPLLPIHQTNILLLNLTRDFTCKL